MPLFWSWVSDKVFFFPFPERLSAASVIPSQQMTDDCDLCAINEAVFWRCASCSANLCRKCKYFHQNRSAFKDHDITLRKPFSEKEFRRIHDIDVKHCKDVSYIRHSHSSEVWLQHDKQLTLVNRNGDVIKCLAFDFPLMALQYEN